MASGGDSIKLFKFIQKTYRDIGIYPPEPNQSRSPINSKNCFFLYCLAQFSLTSYAYFWFQANSMIEYGMVFYTCSTTILSIVVYLIQIWQMKKFLNFIENCERFVEKREYSMQFISFIEFMQFIKLKKNQDPIPRMHTKMSMKKSNNYPNALPMPWFWPQPLLCCSHYSVPQSVIAFWMPEKNRLSYSFWIGTFIHDAKMNWNWNRN